MLAYVLLAVAATGVIWRSSDRLEAASERIATWYGLPQIVKGAIITAVASSFPELSSVVIATLVHGEFELGVASIVGSAIFNILVIPACSVLAGGTLAANRGIVYKESLFYLIAISVLMLTFSFAVIYFPVPDLALHGRMTRPLALIPIALYAVYLFIQYQDTKEHRTESDDSTTDDIRIGREWLTMMACLAVIAAAVEALIWSALEMGKLFGTPAFLWGLTIIAAGTSLPDLFISVKAARQNKSVSSLANVLGSNTFDLLIAVPVGVLIAGSTVINFTRAAPMMGILTAATIVMFVLMRLNMNLNRRDAILLLTLYVAFIVWLFLETLGVTSLLGATG